MNEKDAWNIMLDLQPLMPREKQIDKVFQCSVCNKSYSTKRALQRHKRYECGVEPQFRCHICDRRFFHNFHLKSHLVVHEKYSGY